MIDRTSYTMGVIVGFAVGGLLVSMMWMFAVNMAGK